MAKSDTKLKNAQGIIKKYGLTCEGFGTDELTRLRKDMDRFEELDTRHASYVKHLVGDIIMIVFLALLSDADEWAEIGDFAKKKESWLKQFLVLRNGIPSHDTIQDVISLLDSKMLSNTCLQFIIGKIDTYSEMARHDDPFKKPDIPIVAIDGKTSRGSAGNDTGDGKTRPLHTLNAVSTDYGFCIGQVFVPEKSNEITAVEDLLDLFDVEGVVVTWDALNTQKRNVKKVVDKKGDYVVALKGNHKNLCEEIRDYFEDEGLWAKNPLVGYHKTVEKEHNAVVTREYILSKEIHWVYEKKAWAGLQAIGCVRTTARPHKGEETMDTRYYLSSVCDVSLFARSVRQHWSVEAFHWQMDFTFRDDANKTREKKSAKNLQIMKKAALALLKLIQPLYKMSMKRIRYSLSLDFENEIEKIFSVLDTKKVETQLKDNGQLK